jgi:hypothetical protein
MFLRNLEDKKNDERNLKRAEVVEEKYKFDKLRDMAAK